MRTPVRALLAALAAVAALSIAAAGTSSAATPGVPAHTPSTPAVGATCVIQHPDCNDMGFGGNGHAGAINGGPPVSGAPGKTCGAISAGQGADATVSSEPCQPPSIGPIRPRPQLVAPRAGMTGVRPITFDSATVRPDGRTVDVRFWSGIEPCSVLDHVDVSYGSDTVTITLFEGSDPSAGMVACSDIAVLDQVTVPLDQEVAHRTIVDGAT